MKIAGREISTGLKPYIVCEIGANHAGSIENAIKLISAAKWCGADAVKFQAYTADTITFDGKGPDFTVKEGPWQGESLYALYKRAETPFEWAPLLFARAKTLGITAFASVFDESAVDMLEKLDCPAYKIASAEITDLNLISYAAKTGKPMIISTGMASNCEIVDAGTAVFGEQKRFPIFLHCVSGYPSIVKEANLWKIGLLGGNIGISTHCLDSIIPIAATALGASMIEVHLKLSDVRSEDEQFSLDVYRMNCLIKDVHDTWESLQQSEPKSEESTRQMRRSLYVVKDIAAGEVFTKENVRSIRPAYGLPPNNLPLVLGKPAKCDIKAGTSLKQEHVR